MAVDFGTLGKMSEIYSVMFSLLFRCICSYVINSYENGVKDIIASRRSREMEEIQPLSNSEGERKEKNSCNHVFQKGQLRFFGAHPKYRARDLQAVVFYCSRCWGCLADFQAIITAGVMA